MKPCIIHKIILCAIAILSVEIVAAQILKKPDPGLIIDRSKSILIITPCISGSFHLNDYYLTDISSNDTVYIGNMKSGDYSVKFITDQGTYQRGLSLEKGKVQEIIPCNDSIYLPKDKLYQDETLSKMTGNKYYFPRRAYFYHVTQIAFLNFNVTGSEHPFSYFRSITTINGYQFVPGFCAGLGVSYNFYPLEGLDDDENYYYVDIEKGNFQFLPVFVDVRAHLSSASGRVTPFFKFDLGYNFLLKKSHFHNKNQYDNVSFTMKKGGIYISPGFGLRIFINNLVQITPSIEYSFEKSSYFVNNDRYQVNYNKFNFIKLSLGVSFQYK